MPKYQTPTKLIQAEIQRYIDREEKRIELVITDSLENLIGQGGKFFGKNIITPNGNIWSKICNRWQLTEEY